MMVQLDFTLKVNEAILLRNNLCKVSSVFENVTVTFENAETSVHTNIEWVNVEHENKETCKKAKKYITSLTNPVKTLHLSFPSEFSCDYNIDTLLSEIERESLSFICVLNTNQLKIQSSEIVNATLAQSLIESKLGVDFTVEVIEDKCLPQADNNYIKVDEKLKGFGYKLGYNDEDIKVAASKFSAEPHLLNENTLLQELVKKSPQKLKDQIYSGEENVRLPVKPVPYQSVREQEILEHLRDIVIDGSNIALCHGNKEVFSCRGIEIIVNWFLKRGHKNIHVFVPQWRLEAPKQDTPISDQDILNKLHKEKFLVFTPSRRINGRRVVCYDDRFIVKYAFENDGIIVSNDNFRDLQKENNDWKMFLEQHLLMFTFVNDCFMPPDDPLGRCGPTLDEFLRKGTILNQVCPYKGKCTYGTKCRFYHPEKPIVDEQNVNADRLNVLLNQGKDRLSSTVTDDRHKTEISLRENNVTRQHHSADSNKRKNEQYPTNTPRSMHVQIPCAIEHKMVSTNSSNFMLHQDDVISRGMNRNHPISSQHEQVYRNDNVNNMQKFPTQYSHGKLATQSPTYNMPSNNTHIDPRYQNAQPYLRNTPYYNSQHPEPNQYSIHPTSQSHSTRFTQSRPYPYDSIPSYNNTPQGYTPQGYTPPPPTSGYIHQKQAYNSNMVPHTSLPIASSYQHPSNPYTSRTQQAHYETNTQPTRYESYQHANRYDKHHHTNPYEPHSQSNIYETQTHNDRFEIPQHSNQYDPRSQINRFDTRTSQTPNYDQHKFHKLLELFPGQQHQIQNVLLKNPNEQNIPILVTYVLAEK